MGGFISKKALNEEMKYMSLGEEAYWSVTKTSPIPPPLHTHTHPRGFCKATGTEIISFESIKH